MRERAIFTWYMESSEEVSVAEESEDGWSNFSQLDTQDMLVTEREGDAVAAQVSNVCTAYRYRRA